MLQARGDGVSVCIEATSNQVNQDGGYTGMKPADFHAYVQAIGTEVPVPGGSHEEEELTVTAVADAEKAISVTREAFLALGLKAAWARIVASVVQPGVEFSDSTVHDYDRARAAALS